MLALLAALVNPLDEIPVVVGVLRSPLVGVSDEEILRIGRDCPDRRVRTAVRSFAADRPGFVALNRLARHGPRRIRLLLDLSDRARANVEAALVGVHTP